MFSMCRPSALRVVYSPVTETYHYECLQCGEDWEPKTAKEQRRLADEYKCQTVALGYEYQP